MIANIIGGPHDGSTIVIDIHVTTVVLEEFVIDRVPNRATMPRPISKCACYRRRGDGNFHFVGYEAVPDGA